MLLRKALLRGLLAVVALAGCGYTSEYVPPADGRPRPVWKDNAVVVESAGADASGACTQEVLALTSTEVVRERYAARRAAGGYWVPIYYGPRLVVVSPGIAPVLARPPLFLPSLLPLPRPGLGFGSVPVPGLRLGGGSGSGDAGKAAVLLAVLALLTLPAVDLGLALAPAESPTRSAQAIDQVNAMNDLMRTPGSPCAYPDPGAAGGGG